MFCSPDSLSYFQTRIPHSSRQSPSGIDFFGGLPFDDDSLDRFAPSFATTCTSCSASRAICCCLPLSPQDSSREIRSDTLKHTEELEIQHAGTTSAFLNRDLAPGTLTTKRFGHQSRLSFFSTSSFVVAPKSPRLEPMFGDETEVDSSSQFQLNLKHTGQDSLAGVVLHFHKITSGKKAQLSDFTEELFDIRSPEAQPTYHCKFRNPTAQRARDTPHHVSQCETVTNGQSDGVACHSGVEGKADASQKLWNLVCVHVSRSCVASSSMRAEPLWNLVFNRFRYHARTLTSV
jgi:hypothetical protein